VAVTCPGGIGRVTKSPDVEGLKINASRYRRNKPSIREVSGGSELGKKNG